MSIRLPNPANEVAIRRETIGYTWWCRQRVTHGWRQIGGEASAVMDDYGALVMTGALWASAWWQESWAS